MDFPTCSCRCKKNTDVVCLAFLQFKLDTLHLTIIIFVTVSSVYVVIIFVLIPTAVFAVGLMMS